MVALAPRACGFAFLCAFGVTVAHAQTMEVFAGGRFIVDAPATSVQVTPQSIDVSPTHHLYATDSNGRLLRFTPWLETVTVLPGLPDTANIDLGSPYGIVFSPTGDLQVAGSYGFLRVDQQTFAVQPVGGVGPIGPMAYGPNGNLYFPYQQTHRLYARLPSGLPAVVAGTGQPGFSGDGGPAQLAMLNWPSGVAVDASGNIYVADGQNNRI